jgi:hypothetical protein
VTITASPPRTARRGVEAARPARVLLRDGTPAVLVALGPEDAPELLDLHERLPDRDRYLRFATLHPSDLEGYVRRTVDPATGAVSLDAGATVSPGAFAAALTCLLEDDAVSAVVTVTAATGVSDPAPGVVEAVAAHGAEQGGTPVVDVRLGRATAVERLGLPDPGRFLVSVAEPTTAARALGVAAGRSAWLARPLGPGGRAADALGHRVHRLAPLTDAEAAEMLAGTGLFDTADRAGVVDCLRRVAWLADVLPDVAEVDVNPLVVGVRRCTALDGRVRVEDAGG